MAYTRHDWVNDEAPALSAATLTEVEDGIVDEEAARIAGDADEATARDAAIAALSAIYVPAAGLTELAQDAIGSALTDTATLDLAYNDGAGTISGTVLDSPKINGIAVTGTPSAGMVPTATSGSAATWQAPSGGGGGTAASTTFTPAGNLASTNVQTALVELDTEKAAISDLAPLSNNVPLAPSGAGSAGTSNEAMRADAVIPTTGLVALDGGNGLTLAGSVKVTGALTSCFDAKNSIYGNANFRGFDSAGTTENTRIGNDSFIRAGGFSDMALSASVSMSGGLVSLGGASGLKLTTAGAGITLKAPSGGIERYLALDVAGRLNVPIGAYADSWAVNNVLSGTKDVGGTDRSHFNNFGDLVVDVTNQNVADNAAWGGTVPLTVRHDGTGTLAGNLIEAKLGSAIRFSASKDGDAELPTAGKGLILKSPDGTRYRITVPNGGASVTITAA